MIGTMITTTHSLAYLMELDLGPLLVERELVGVLVEHPSPFHQQNPQRVVEGVDRLHVIIIIMINSSSSSSSSSSITTTITTTTITIIILMTSLPP
jgi:MinD superfamily P-loop ATPase